MSFTPRLTLTLLFIEDPIDKGFTAFFAEYPNIVVDAETKDLAKDKLFQVMNTVFEYKRTQSLNENSLKHSQFTTEQYNADLALA